MRYRFKVQRSHFWYILFALLVGRFTYGWVFAKDKKGQFLELLRNQSLLYENVRSHLFFSNNRALLYIDICLDATFIKQRKSKLRNWKRKLRIALIGFIIGMRIYFNVCIQ